MPKGKYTRTPEMKARRSAAQKKRLSDPKNNPFFGKHHSEETKQKISFARTGIKRDADERKQEKRNKSANWIATHPERVRELDIKYLPKRANYIRERRRQRREAVVKKLGGRCSSLACRWLNNDGTFGCDDFRLLQIDHKKGGGTKERSTLSYDKMLCKVLADASGYQLLCACCNWLKAHECKEFACMEKHK